MIRNFEPCIVPGLLQVPDYIRAILAVGTTGAVRNSGTLLDFRLARQKVLAQAKPPRYVAIISESVLRHQIGTPYVMRGQRQWLARAARLDHVTLRVLPNSASANLALAGAFHLIALRPPGGLTVSVVEQFASSLFVEDEEEIRGHEVIFNRLVDASLDEGSSLELIDR